LYNLIILKGNISSLKKTIESHEKTPTNISFPSLNFDNLAGRINDETPQGIVKTL
jgi:hypothetical protein